MCVCVCVYHLKVCTFIHLHKFRTRLVGRIKTSFLANKYVWDLITNHKYALNNRRDLWFPILLLKYSREAIGVSGRAIMTEFAHSRGHTRDQMLAKDVHFSLIQRRNREFEAQKSGIHKFDSGCQRFLFRKNYSFLYCVLLLFVCHFFKIFFIECSLYQKLYTKCSHRFV